MTSALKVLTKYSKYLEEGSPGFKGKGIFYYDYQSLAKPEIIRYKKRLFDNYQKPISKDIQILLTEPPRKPFNNNQGFKKLKTHIEEYNDRVHFCFMAAPYGIIPEYLAETYPTSQYQIAKPLDHETIQYTVACIMEYLEKHSMKHTIIVHSNTQIDNELLNRLEGRFPTILGEELGKTEVGEKLVNLIKHLLKHRTTTF
jgi:7-cyano-7-deazaguanine tRNA-ribosyltransferase